MREVTIYAIKPHQVRANSFIGFVDIYFIPSMERIFHVGNGEMLMVEHETVERLRLQIHTIRRINRADEYIAITPELEAILMLPLKARLVEVERQAAQQAHEAKVLRQRLATFNALPWYRRVWVAMRRKI